MRYWIRPEFCGFAHIYRGLNTDSLDFQTAATTYRHSFFDGDPLNEVPDSYVILLGWKK
mgnify:FL=1